MACDVSPVAMFLYNIGWCTRCLEASLSFLTLCILLFVFVCTILSLFFLCCVFAWTLDAIIWQTALNRSLLFCLFVYLLVQCSMYNVQFCICLYNHLADRAGQVIAHSKSDRWNCPLITTSNCPLVHWVQTRTIYWQEDSVQILKLTKVLTNF